MTSETVQLARKVQIKDALSNLVSARLLSISNFITYKPAFSLIRKLDALSSASTFRSFHNDAKSMSKTMKKKRRRKRKTNSAMITKAENLTKQFFYSRLLDMYCLINEQECFIGFKTTRRSRVVLDPIKHDLRVY